MKFSYLEELITVHKPTDEFIRKLFIFLDIHDFAGFASTVNTEFDITFLLRFLAKSTL